MNMDTPEDRLATAVQIERVERIQHGLMNGDEGAEADALKMIEQIAEMENGLMFLMSGIGAVLQCMARGTSDEETM